MIHDLTLDQLILYRQQFQLHPSQRYTSSILLLIFFIRYNKFDINGGEAATDEEKGGAAVGVANSLSKINASNAAGPSEIETAQEVGGVEEKL